MEEELANYKSLLADFLKIHIPKSEKTYMGICQYPGSRFEEICSRVLAYFFNPKEEHGLRDLWFRALNLCIKQEGECCPPRNILLEERTYNVEGNENKRIDIIIETYSTVYVIENKIGASLYNNLDVYSKHVKKKYPNYEYRNLVLTAHSLNPSEKKIVEDHNFRELSYKNLFEQVNSIIGEYINDADVKQLTFMMDFMKTLNNKMNFMENKKRAEFFSENKENVENLIRNYNEWRDEVFKIQSDTIKDLCHIIEEDTQGHWWIYQNWLLATCFNDGTEKKIGIEAHYIEKYNDPCGKIKIKITTWNVDGASSLQCWEPYKEDITKKYPGCTVENINNRIYFLVKEIGGSNTEEIKKTIHDCYKFLKDLAAKKMM